MAALNGTTTFADADGAVTVILGVAVLLVLALLVVRAVAQRWRGHGRSSPRTTTPARGDIAADDNDRVAALAGPVGTPVPNASERPSKPLESTPESDLPRLPLDTIAPFARTLERSRRLWVAESRLRDELSALPKDVWLVEEHVLEGSFRIPFVVVGPTGVFVLCATDGPWTIGDLQTLTAHADRLQRQLPGWEGEIEVVMCLAFETVEIRLWVDGQSEAHYRGWVIGTGDLVPWLIAFEPAPGGGLHPGDLRRLDREALPDWDRHRTARLPETPNFG